MFSFQLWSARIGSHHSGRVFSYIMMIQALREKISVTYLLVFYLCHETFKTLPRSTCIGREEKMQLKWYPEVGFGSATDCSNYSILLLSS
jgi:hypothetical protein